MRLWSWLRTPDGIDWPRALLVALSVTLVLALGVVASTSAASFGLYNPAWDGTSEFRAHVAADDTVEHDLVRNTQAYTEGEANETVAFVIAPDEPYTDDDAARVQTFVENGGTLVVFENFGEPGNALLADVGAEARVDGRLLRDERYHYRGPPMPIATEVANHTATQGVDQLTLNYATAVGPGNATVLVTTSEYTYLGDEETDLEEVEDLQAYPVVTTENVSNGSVVVVGDPSLTINTMFDQPDNAAFLTNLYAGHDRVLFDISHASDLPPLTAAMVAVRGSPLAQLGVGLVGIGLVAVLVRSDRSTLKRVLTRYRGQRTTATAKALERSPDALSEEEWAERLRHRHPEWDDDRIQRVATAVSRATHDQPDES
ncbi:DUF4350 domain-containing protein [Natronosalvus rutilus]|uniref:DUF4350 domain-containing protein n=1 Tax=Natronosalvus rutilus TaxID=2953753 RepID=A0A9E7SWE9_9EURY|nr:DUF4350 domain-containing protein [Natronosalvus rutilus]UTF55435.1 DUF4350 domain-containing protein [Natronosalvus rutilus]